MNKFKFGFCEVSMLGGVALLIAAHATAGIVLIVLGVTGALCDYALKFQQEQKAQEKIAQLIEEISKSNTGAGDLGHNAGVAVAQLLSLLQQFVQDNDHGTTGNGWPN